MPVAEYGQPSHWLTVITVDHTRFGLSPDEVRRYLLDHSVESRPAWKPMHLQPAFAGAPVVGGAVGRRIFETGLCLPSGSNLTAAQQERVIDLVLRAPASITRSSSELAVRARPCA